MDIRTITFTLLLLSSSIIPFPFQRNQDATQKTVATDPPPSEEPGEKGVEPEED